jgi:hypothetical protein
MSITPGSPAAADAAMSPGHAHCAAVGLTLLRRSWRWRDDASLSSWLMMDPA